MSDPDATRRLLVVYHSRTGTTRSLVDAITAAARSAADATALDVEERHAFEAGPDDVLASSGILLATPANFGYMSGAMKDFLERVYHPCLELTAGLPYGLLLKGSTDVDGALSSLEKILVGLRWRRVLPPVLVVGDVLPHHLEAAAELGAAMGAGLEAGIF